VRARDYAKLYWSTCPVLFRPDTGNEVYCGTIKLFRLSRRKVRRFLKMSVIALRREPTCSTPRHTTLRVVTDVMHALLKNRSVLFSVLNEMECASSSSSDEWELELEECAAALLINN
jgi:hypothetical protein